MLATRDIYVFLLKGLPFNGVLAVRRQIADGLRRCRPADCEQQENLADAVFKFVP